jgi:nitrogenase molybdenum-iron protein alpha/beta subunit
MSTLGAKIQQVFDEPACATNLAKPNKERKKGCNKLLAPGAATGGCAFDGAKIALQPITDVAHLVHGPINCESHSWDGRGSKSSGPLLYRTSFTAARKMEERYGIPFLEGSFYGIGDSSDAPRKISQLLVDRGAPAELLGRTEAVIVREEARAWQRIAPFKSHLDGKRVLLFTVGVKSWSVVAALQEAGLVIIGTSTKKSTPDDKERIKELVKDDAHMFDDRKPREMYKMLKEARADIMLSGGRSQFVALKAKMPRLDIN